MAGLEVFNFVSEEVAKRMSKIIASKISMVIQHDKVQNNLKNVLLNYADDSCAPYNMAKVNENILKKVERVETNNQELRILTCTGILQQQDEDDQAIDDEIQRISDEKNNKDKETLEKTLKDDKETIKARIERDIDELKTKIKGKSSFFKDNDPDLEVPGLERKIKKRSDQLTELEKLIINNSGGGNRKKYYGGAQRITIKTFKSNENDNKTSPLSPLSPQSLQKSNNSEITDDVEVILKEDMKELLTPFYQWALQQPTKAIEKIKEKLEELKLKIMDPNGKFMKYAKNVFECALRKVLIRSLAPHFSDSLQRQIFLDPEFTKKVEEMLNEKLDNDNKKDVYSKVLCDSEKSRKGVSSLRRLCSENSMCKKNSNMPEPEHERREKNREKNREKRNTSGSGLSKEEERELDSIIGSNSALDKEDKKTFKKMVGIVKVHHAKNPTQSLIETLEDPDVESKIQNELGWWAVRNPKKAREAMKILPIILEPNK